jgi:hypothetical protein
LKICLNRKDRNERTQSKGQWEKLNEGAQKWSTNWNIYDLGDVGTTKCALSNKKARHNSLRSNQA